MRDLTDQRRQEAIGLLRVAENRLGTETERRMEAEQLNREMEDRLRKAERVANALQGSSLEQRDEAFWMVEEYSYRFMRSYRRDGGKLPVYRRRPRRSALILTP